jgi:hypothetical protein
MEVTGACGELVFPSITRDLVWLDASVSVIEQDDSGLLDNGIVASFFPFEFHLVSGFFRRTHRA